MIKNKPYLNMLVMLLLSFLIMYSVMFLNVVQWEHIYLSNTRLYMALLMVLPMLWLKLIFMKEMYKNKRMNVVIAGGSALLFVLCLCFLRMQVFIGDRQYMKGMISHHSSAILTSQEASIRDPEVRILAKSIIETQEKEIAEMKELLNKLNRKSK